MLSSIVTKAIYLFTLIIIMIIIVTIAYWDKGGRKFKTESESGENEKQKRKTANVKWINTLKKHLQNIHKHLESQ